MDFLPARRHFGPGDTVAFKEVEEVVKFLHEDGSVSGDVRPLDIPVGNPEGEAIKAVRC